LLNADPAAADDLTICSFNIQFLGNSERRDHDALALIVRAYDVVLVQEVLAPPYPGMFPDGTPFRPDKEVATFFDAMKGHGFAYELSAEDTGTGPQNHLNSSATEWFVAFYKPSKVKVADDLPSGFLAEDRTDHADYERVPHAFGFRNQHNTLDFILISVHLRPDPGREPRARRKHELAWIAEWVDEHDSEEQDFIVAGDMNIYSRDELADATPVEFVSLNDECRATNTNPGSPRPYDHVMYRPEFTSEEIDEEFDLRVVDLIEAARPLWNPDNGPFPGADPYHHDRFRAYYSDHHPVVFRLHPSAEDE
jgi:endonuclease/exonuclease/phosphatase family metal-dependent hydrolase